MEGDEKAHTCKNTVRYFNPLPPHGGRLQSARTSFGKVEFQSTPSAWRETFSRLLVYRRFLYFNPLPPHGGRPIVFRTGQHLVFISIHSLRMEGDYAAGKGYTFWEISIHSLRMEGDYAAGKGYTFWEISIHSLRMEGDWKVVCCDHADCDFNPLPPHGGRLRYTDTCEWCGKFQSTPSAWRETFLRSRRHCRFRHFNPLPPHGGRLPRIRLPR